MLIPGVNCLEAKNTPDACVQGSCFDKPIECKYGEVCYSGQCTPFSTLTTIAVLPSQFQLVSFTAPQNTCAVINITDTSSSIEFLFRKANPPTKNLYELQAANADRTTLTLCPPNSVWFFRAYNPTTTTKIVSYSVEPTNEVIPQTNDPEIEITATTTDGSINESNVMKPCLLIVGFLVYVLVNCY